MAINPLTEAEKDYTFSLGFLQEWLKDAPAAVKEQLATLASGVTAYREKYVSIQEDFDKLNAQHNQLLQSSAQFLEFMRQQKERIDQTEALIEEQKGDHNWTRERRGLPPFIET